MLTVYNTLAREKQQFVPIEAGKVRMYVCGMTVYDLCHVGHARMLSSFDVVYRWLKASGLEVTFVRNITDIDDKIIKRAAENGETIDALTERTIRFMHEDCAQLNLLPPTFEPRATEHIHGMHELIAQLIAKGRAYPAANGDVYYAVREFPGYGKLSGKSLEDLRAGERVAVDEFKRDPLDFVLWKAAKPFPHHENEIAQSECCTGRTFVKYWLHCAHLVVEGRKMSKSLGNFFTLRDLLERGIDPMAIRWVLLATHYRQPNNFSFEAVDAARESLRRIRDFRDRLKTVRGGGGLAQQCAACEAAFQEALDDDLNISGALGVVLDFIRDVNKLVDDGVAGAEGAREALTLMDRLDRVTGLFGDAPEAAVPQDVLDLVQARQDARRAKDFAKADAVRDQLRSLGWILEDTADGPRVKRA